MENTKRDIKLLVVDLDGTLLNEKHALSDRNRDALKKAQEAGVQISLATGKTRASAESIIKGLKLASFGIFVQGTILYNGDGTIRSQKTLDVDTARRVINYAESNGFEVLAYSGNRLLARNNDDIFMSLVAFHEPEPQAVGPLVNTIANTRINKLLVLGNSGRKLKALRWQLDQQVGTHVTFTTAAVSNQLEVLPKGAGKASCLKALLKESGIALENVMAIGDADNDIEMLEIAGLGIAVGNAGENVKAAANDVVGTNEADGVAEAIEKYILKPAAEATKAEQESAPEAKEDTKQEATEVKTEESTS